jgi:hypothetical protein
MIQRSSRTMTHFDIKGDIHGQVGKLERLFRVLGYQKTDGVHGSADRKAVFVVDLIDRGPAIGEALEIVKAMVDAGFSYRSYMFPPNDVSPAIRIAAENHAPPYPRQAPPVIFGHYWLPFGAPHSPLAANVAWADFSAGAEGPLAPYRWDGESQVDSAKFVFSD